MLTQPVLAGSYPTHSAGVRATATVQTPLGYKTFNEPDNINLSEPLIVQYPSIGGMQLLIEIDGRPVSIISLEKPDGLPTDPAFERICAVLLEQTSYIEGQSCLVTLISISQ